jgi:hypothetical protein
MRTLLASTLVVMVFSQAAGAITGNELKMWMNEEEALKDGRPGANVYKAGLYDGYVRAVAEMFDGSAWCSRPGVTVGQFMDVVSKFLRDTPEKLDEHASVLILDALAKAFPCKR